MAGPSSSGGKGGKSFQGVKTAAQAAATAMSVAGIGQGQVALLRPAGASSTQLGAHRPPRNNVWITERQFHQRKNPEEYTTAEDRGDAPEQADQAEQLHDIPKEDDGDTGSESGESDQQEDSYIERHSAWVHVLDENLQKMRKNPAEKMASAEFEMDAEVTLHQLLGVNVVSICQLDPFCFHVQVDSGTSKAHIFANSPLKMGNKMVFPLPWDTRFSTKDLKSRAVPVWLELYNVHPGLMRFGLNMLRKIGPIIYAAKNTETQRINIVRGCVLMDLSRPLPDFILIVVPELPGKTMKQRIRYLRLPDACFSCRHRGHFARSCPLNEGRTEPNMAQRFPSPQRANPQRATPEGRTGASGAQGAARGTGSPSSKEGPTEEGVPPQVTPPGSGEEFRVVRRKGKPKFHTSEIKKTMRVAGPGFFRGKWRRIIIIVQTPAGEIE
ncbi:hypothetical protein R1sor_011719 [Riccia sorocarpa]|uniref:CCHC-type domain-containing protein n=1 Tax=Riccia sorocarpa TaxID=122646 RepID=A0ABD3I235_9MARC